MRVTKQVKFLVSHNEHISDREYLQLILFFRFLTVIVFYPAFPRKLSLLGETIELWLGNQSGLGACHASISKFTYGELEENQVTGKMAGTTWKGLSSWADACPLARTPGRFKTDLGCSRLVWSPGPSVIVTKRWINDPNGVTSNVRK